MSNNKLFECPFCYNTDGNHLWDCPNNPININNNQCGILKDVNVAYSDSTSVDEIALYKLKQSSIRLKEMLGITSGDIERAIKEFRKNY